MNTSIIKNKGLNVPVCLNSFSKVNMKYADSAPDLKVIILKYF